MKTFSNRHNAEQAVRSIFARLSLEDADYLIAQQPDGRVHPVVYLDSQVGFEDKLTMAGFSVMSGRLPAHLSNRQMEPL